MIQRIQTVWLSLTVIFCIACLCSNIGYYLCGPDEMANLSNFNFTTIEPYDTLECSGPWALGILLILTIFLSILSILLFRKRMRQLRLTIMSSLLLVGYILVYAFFIYVYELKLEETFTENEIRFRIGVAAIYPVLSLIFNYLAIHGIRKDEALVRSLDRIR